MIAWLIRVSNNLCSLLSSDTLNYNDNDVNQYIIHPFNYYLGTIFSGLKITWKLLENCLNQYNHRLIIINYNMHSLIIITKIIVR